MKFTLALLIVQQKDKKIFILKNGYMTQHVFYSLLETVLQNHISTLEINSDHNCHFK